MFSFTECKVVDASSNHELFLMHSFDGDSVCFDYSRLNVVQTEFYPNAAFNVRTFRFNYDGAAAAESQQQTIMCSLHLGPVSEISQEQAQNCSCYTRSDCESPGKKIKYYFENWSIINSLRTLKNSRIEDCERSLRTFLN